jgi:cytidyltransferase-like protein
MSSNYRNLYLKYKFKYTELKKLYGGAQKNIGIYVGRFQPLHSAHLEIILKGLRDEDYMIVFIGSANEMNTERNPYSPSIRKEFIINSIRTIDPQLLNKLSIISINNTAKDKWNDWFIDLNKKIIEELNKEFKTAVTEENVNTVYLLSLYGSRKDVETSSYIDEIFNKSIVKNSKLVEPTIEGDSTLNATTVRKIISETKSDNLFCKLKPNINSDVIDIIINEKEKKELESLDIKKEKILTFKKRTSELNKEESDSLFNLYKKTYAEIEKKTGRVYENLESIKQLYQDVIYFVKNDIIFGGFFSTKFRYANKISLILHDNTAYGKQYVYDILNKLLNQYGYILEASLGAKHILKNYYNLKPLDIEVVKFVFGAENIEEKNVSGDILYNRKTKNHLIEDKQLFGKLCTKKYSKSWSTKMVLNKNIFNGCDLLLDNIIYNSYDIFENIFTGIATLTYISNIFTPYNNLDSEAIVSNMVENHKVKINNIPDDNKFNIENNGFTLVNLFDLDKHNVMTCFLSELKNKMVANNNYILDDSSDRTKFRKSLEIFCSHLMKEHKELFGNSLPDYDAIVCLDAVPRDTNSANSNSKFNAIKLVHSDLYPFNNIGDILWSFRNTWYGKISEVITDIEDEELNKETNRNKWNNKVVGIFNFWISLTNGITDNGLALLDFGLKSHNFLVPYKAFRTATRAIDNVNFISTSVKYDPSHKWYTKYNMKFGDCIIFNTIGSPHTGFNYDNGSNKNRKSIELRIMLLKNVTIKPNPIHVSPNIL